MNKKDILREYRRRYHIYNENYTRIDSNIQPLVNWFRKQGFITFASCGSHIFDYNGKPILCGQAYVAFYYSEEDKDKINELLAIKFPKSKDYRIMWSPFNDNRMTFDIFFNTRYNRMKHLRKIYDAMGVEYEPGLKLEKHRPTWKVLQKEGKTIYKVDKSMV